MTKTLQTEMIAVGTELLLGQITNTNATWISKQLAENGINVFYHSVVGDNLKRLAALFQQAQERSDIIIVTGGLGPTEDDLSREAFQIISEIPIVEDTYSLNKIEAFFAERNAEMTDNNRRQARVFKDSKVLENLVGMAPGNIVQFHDRTWIFLPGVPREMKQLFTDYVLPYLKERNGEMVIHSTVLRFIGIGESVLEDRLSPIIQAQANPTIAPLAGKDSVTLRISAKAASKETAIDMINEVKEQILEIVGDYFYGEDDETLEKVIADLLRQYDKDISSAESLTGGLFANKFVSHPGASSVYKGAVVCYDTSIKERVLQVKTETIKKVGTVSKECAEELATNVRSLLNSSIGISFTGVAGPTEMEGKKVGTVFISIADENGYLQTEKCFFQGNRQQIRYRSVIKGMELLFHYLNRTLPK